MAMNEMIIDTLRREICRLEQQISKLGSSDGVRYYRRELEDTLARRRRLLDRYQSHEAFHQADGSDISTSVRRQDSAPAY
jgi:hypothetical protein